MQQTLSGVIGRDLDEEAKVRNEASRVLWRSTGSRDQPRRTSALPSSPRHRRQTGTERNSTEESVESTPPFLRYYPTAHFLRKLHGSEELLRWSDSAVDGDGVIVLADKTGDDDMLPTMGQAPVVNNAKDAVVVEMNSLTLNSEVLISSNGDIGCKGEAGIGSKGGAGTGTGGGPSTGSSFTRSTTDGALKFKAAIQTTLMASSTASAFRRGTGASPAVRFAQHIQLPDEDEGVDLDESEEVHACSGMQPVTNSMWL